jgi:hypothetical protein
MTKPFFSITSHRTNFMNSIHRRLTMFLAIPLIIGSVISISGCEPKEKVIDIDTPAGNIEVERTKGNGRTDVDINIDKKE